MKKERPEYEEPKTQWCHMCDKVIDLKNDDYKVQIFTARVFCTDDCWKKHLESDGLA